MSDNVCEREQKRESKRERIAAARQAISDARLLLDTALVLLEHKRHDDE